MKKRNTGKKATKNVIGITPEERKQAISEEAYHLAEQHGFGSGREMDDWLKAEAKIEHIFGPADA